MDRRINSIQFLRGFAALMVCFFHMKGLLPDQQIGKTLFGSGSLGVPLFFMISGFIMVHSAREQERGPRVALRFMGRRWLRIGPLYYLATLVYISVLQQWSFYTEHPQFLLSTLFFVPTFSNPVGPSLGMPPLEVGWSLNYEMYFYILLSISLLFGKLRWASLFLLLLIPVLVFPLIQPGYYLQNLSQTYPWPGYLQLMGHPVLLFFVAGLLLGFLFRRPIPITQPAWLLKLMVLLSFGLFFLLYAGKIKLFTPHLQTILVCAALMTTLLVAERSGALRFPQWLVFPGTISYSLYLIHPIVLHATPKALRAMSFPHALQGWWYFGLQLSLMLVISWLSYHYIEQKLVVGTSLSCLSPRERDDTSR